MSENYPRISAQQIRMDFDGTFKTITKKGQSRPFSVDTILRDLVDGGIPIIDSIDVVYTIRPHLVSDISTTKILNLINQALKSLNLESKYMAGNFLEPITLEFEDGSQKVLNFKQIKAILREELSGFNYTVNTFKLFVDELHRVILSLRNRKIKIETIKKIVPSVLRNVIGLNPLSPRRLEDDYSSFVRIYNTLEKAWEGLPYNDKKNLVINLYEGIYRIFLMSFDYLPGHNLQSTITQLNQLIAVLSKEQNTFLSDKQVYLLGKSSRTISELLSSQKQVVLADKIDWLRTTEILKDLIDTLHHRNRILWLLVIDESGNELFAKFTQESKKKYRNLLGMAITGIQSIVSEITDKSIRQIEQDEGVILIERREDFSVISLMDIESPYLSHKLSAMADFIESKLVDQIRDFRGQVDVFYPLLEEYITKEMHSVFI